MSFHKIFLIILIILTELLYSQGYICAIGGGSENYNDWSDEPYRWIVQKSDSGKIIILSYSDASSWLPNYFMWLGADTAYNKTISSTTIANLQSTYDELITAKAIFLRGGDQWQYIRLWKGTKTEDAIKYVFQNGGVIAGTSAGAMVLGEFDFSAQNGSAYPDEALLNPFYSRMKFENNFLNLMPNVLIDTHLMERGRHGRLIAMLYNIFYTYGKKIIGAGIDDRTAICIYPDKSAVVMGSGSVAVFYFDGKTKLSEFTNNKYTIENLRGHLLTKNWKFDFQNLDILEVPASAKVLDSSAGFSFSKTNFYLTGNNDISLHTNQNLSQFLISNNSTNILLITHPGFSGTNTIINYLQSNNYNYSVLYLDSLVLNIPEEASKISAATCFIIAGDSLKHLTLLNQQGTLLSDSFYSSINQSKPIFFFGNSGKIAGQFYVDNVDLDNLASFRGRMTNNNGLSIFDDLIFQPMIYENSNFYENRMSSVLWGMMRNRKRFGLYLNGTGRVEISKFDSSLSGNVSIPYLIIDARDALYIDSSTYRASGSVGPRQVVAIDKFRISITNHSQIKYLFNKGKFDQLTSVNELSEEVEFEPFELHQNFPNPFNNETKIRFTFRSDKQKFVSLKVFNILGQNVKVLFNDFLNAGYYELDFKATDLPNGIYFLRLEIDNYSQTRKMVLLK
ncbi:MAG: Type 1 glutamine amidotransferase-like domain-containing protein [Ignavibacteria bacterium]|nr:type 1 glutamine amidotransferase-like domain-containing protein [Ignavibacteria bacterium]